jgi:hypothetical protein
MAGPLDSIDSNRYANTERFAYIWAISKKASKSSTWCLVIDGAGRAGMRLQSRNSGQARFQHHRDGDVILIHIVRHPGGLNASSIIATAPNDIAEQLAAHLNEQYLHSNPDLKAYPKVDGAPSSVTLTMRLDTIDPDLIQQKLILLSDEAAALRRDIAEQAAIACIRWASRRKLRR